MNTERLTSEIGPPPPLWVWLIIVCVMGLLAWGLSYFLEVNREAEASRRLKQEQRVNDWLKLRECVNVDYKERVGRIYRCNDGLLYSLPDVRQEVDKW